MTNLKYYDPRLLRAIIGQGLQPVEAGMQVEDYLDRMAERQLRRQEMETLWLLRHRRAHQRREARS